MLVSPAALSTVLGLLHFPHPGIKLLNYSANTFISGSICSVVAWDLMVRFFSKIVIVFNVIFNFIHYQTG